MSQAAANRALVLSALTRCVGNVVSLAARLGMHQTRVYRAILDLKIRGMIEAVDGGFEGSVYEELWKVRTDETNE